MCANFWLIVENCFEHIADNLPYVDTNNAVALGASYGGYMISEFSAPHSFLSELLLTISLSLRKIGSKAIH